MRQTGIRCSAAGSLLLAVWLLWSWERLDRIRVGLIRELTLPGAADSWPTRSQDLSGWPLWCLPAFVGALFLGCGLVLVLLTGGRQRGA